MVEQGLAILPVEGRVKFILGQLAAVDIDFNLERKVINASPSELDQLIRVEKRRLERRVQIVGNAFPEVCDDARKWLELSRQGWSARPDQAWGITQKMDAIVLSYRSDWRKPLEVLFEVVRRDLQDLENLSY